jgi:hypothetical protein
MVLFWFVSFWIRKDLLPLYYAIGTDRKGVSKQRNAVPLGAVIVTQCLAIVPVTRKA